MLLILILFLVTTSADEQESNIVFREPDPTNCTCVPYYQCSEETGHVVTDGADLLDTRGFTKNHGCVGYFDVCCNLTTPPTKFKPITHKGCGYRNLTGYVWSGELYHQPKPAGSKIYKCGVSAIHKQVVLTAAHCVNTTEEGDWMVYIDTTVYKIRTIIVHPDYNTRTLQNDIAMIILQTPFSVNEEPNIICIPPPGTTITHSRCVVSNGKETNIGNYKTMLQLAIYPQNKCEAILRNTRLGIYFQLHKTFLCAGGEIYGESCGGDGGSPLICPVPAQPGRYHQVGIVSWGIGCGENNIPDVYINVALFRDWIDSVMIENKFNINSYRY